MNTFIFIGRLTKNPELRYTPDQKAACEFNIAIDRGKDKGADFPRIKAFGREAENLERFKKRGDLIGIQGHIKTGSYEKDGKTVYFQDLIADRIEYLTSKKENAETEPTPNAEFFGGYDF